MAIYLDHAATSWPKPPAVRDAILQCLNEVTGNPGRSGHAGAVAAARVVLRAREAVAALLGAPDPSRVVFTKNATEALNLAIFGLLNPGDHVITTSVEHNSVMRPLRYLAGQGVDVTVLPCAPDGSLDPVLVTGALRRSTRLVVTTHASNVLGTLLPIAEIGAIARAAGVPYLVDAAQTAGAYPLQLAALPVDLLAFPGHKALLGPTGTGGLYIREGITLRPLLRGGTGSQSELEEQPDFLPDVYESGTLNVVGLAGLAAAAEYLAATGVVAVRAHEQALLDRFLRLARANPRIIMYGSGEPARQVGVVSLNLEGLLPSDTGLLLDRMYGIACRVGLHCAPAAHRTAGTYPGGTVRFSFGFDTSTADVDMTLAALVELSGMARRRGRGRADARNN